jgi:hypothetical protein
VTRIRARLLAVPAALTLAMSVSGCGAGFLAATNRPYVPSNGSSFTAGTMDARNVMLVADPDRPNTFELLGALVNNADAPQTLTGVTVEGAGKVPLTPITVAGHSIITTGGEPTSSIVVPDAKFAAGDFTQVTLTFSTVGAVTRDVLALTREGTTSGG